jgi:hypothetical protein
VAPHDSASTATGTTERPTTGSKAQTEVGGGVERGALPASALKDALTSSVQTKTGAPVGVRK